MLSAGARLGPYEVVSPLGAGGMGEVYRARDTKLGRDVALKVLPEGALTDDEARRRFRKEADALVRLAHPHIATIHDFDSADGIDFLVMELVRGPSLGDELEEKGTLPEKTVVRLGTQLARGLQAAHEEGIVHRDLKPANLQLTPDGLLKILDFGLARLLPSETPGEQTAATQTAIGQVAGTLPYMSPEQLRGRGVDARTDLYAAGAVLYEMATGRRLFSKPSTAELTEAILNEDPRPPRELNERLSPGLEAVILKALDKDPELRHQTAKDLLVDLERLQQRSDPRSTGVTAAQRTADTARGIPHGTPEAEPRTGSVEGAQPTAESDGRRGWLPWAIAAVMTVLALLGAFRSDDRGTWSPPRAHLQIVLPEGLRLAAETTHPTLAVSPDGTRLAFVASNGQSRRLYLRNLGDDQARPLEGTDGAGSPFFSPDGRWIAFITDAKLMKVSSSGGAPTAVSAFMMPVSVNRGLTWTSAGSLVVSGSPNSGLSAGPLGGESGLGELPQGLEGGDDPLAGRMAPRLVAAIRQVTDPTAPFTWPMALPDGRNVLFTDNSADDLEAARVAALSLTTGSVTPLEVVGSNPRYSSTGHILYGRGGALYATPFHAARLEMSGAEFQLVDGVRSESNGAVHYAVGGGTLAYVAGRGLVEYELVWIDRQGRTETLVESGERMFTPRLSPDASQLALTIGGASTDVWLFDLERKSLTRRLTTHPGEDFGAVWHPDGRQIAVTTEFEDSGPAMAWMPEPGGPLEVLIESPGWGNWDFPSSWSPDGASLAFLARRSGRADIALTSQDKRGEWTPFLETAANEAAPAFSPDGRWLAYVSDETGRYEVYVRPFPGPGPRTPISSGGGIEPVWARDGRELFFRHGDRIMGARVDRSSRDFVAGRPEPVVGGVVLDDLAGFGAELPNYDVSPDGTRFVIARRKAAGPATVIDVVLNWSETLLGASEGER